ncbi:hypothetical protein DL764_003708 [Monosporascus ibericus]|uniref:Uncharacterized protein n=1 Tax=Monosporascus ibericus TaxID=155417 RepID=A0A4Q4TFE2_9PEZI|nr:hypothetical protein DL764_003708 [Monosporascus ibericus]
MPTVARPVPIGPYHRSRDSLALGFVRLDPTTFINYNTAFHIVSKPTRDNPRQLKSLPVAIASEVGRSMSTSVPVGNLIPSYPSQSQNAAGAKGNYVNAETPETPVLGMAVLGVSARAGSSWSWSDRLQHCSL